MTRPQVEQREYAYAVSGGACEVCGKPMGMGQPQAAHRIGNTKTNRAKYGSLVIDHPLNVGYTCSLECNGKLDISMRPVQCLELCARIYAYELRKRCGKCEEK